MSIKPIDLQTSISQMFEVGKTEHARADDIAKQQHLLDKEAMDKSSLVNSRLDEAKKGEKTAIKNEEHESGKKAGAGTGEKNKKEKKKKPDKAPGDDSMGRFIDVLK
ncbi:MAG: hypothetical protein MUD12_03550 [Spirochaetes bacterium]|jgi:hypothetical protein|nr:hypothetical protein [Spirochaetota bacterium]